VLNDSKKLSAGTRSELRKVIESEAVTYGIGFVSEKEIDRINILNASILAMHRAIEKLDPEPCILLVDGNRFKPFREIKHHCVVKGDAIFASIAAASVLAKTYRDEYMQAIHMEHPLFGWKTNKGYPTRDHRLAILKHGPTEYHRKSFRLLNDQMELDFS
jgi:ribonuclease HII